ncbi:MAG: DUF928 domain-containing protein [Leptolyngbyaceae cyanobacterium RU_5_1]|nr:DUF928 domain-containing protein [Leptolyngbyaceae cyanobacterium RU_5_1]
MKLFIYSTGLGLAIALNSLVFQDVTTAQMRLPHAAQKQAAKSVRFVRREVPPGRPPGGRYRGGGTRSIDSQMGCPAVTTPLIALVPFTENYLPGQEDKPPITHVWGYTTAAHPTLWFYVPYTNQSLSATFSLQNEDSSTEMYETSVSLPKQAGFIRVQVPETKLALQAGNRYRWFLGIDCTSANASASPSTRETIYVEGTILRDAVKPDLASQLASASPEQKVALYAENGFWHDALNTLAELRQQRPHDPALLQDWQRLLEGMGTSRVFKPKDIESKPFVN